MVDQDQNQGQVKDNQSTQGNAQDLKAAHDQENARVGYQTAIDLWGILVQTSWSRFNAMLVANSIIVSIIVLALPNKETLYMFIIIFPFIGITLCIIWFLLMRRDSKYQNYYVRSARELEREYLDPVQTVLRGGEFKENVEIFINDGFNPKKFKIGWIRLFTTSNLSYAVISLFVIVYIILIYTVLLIIYPTFQSWYGLLRIIF